MKAKATFVPVIKNHDTKTKSANNIQGEHKVFPWLQTFITRKLRGIQTCVFTIT